MGLILLVEDEPGAVALMRRYMENSSMEHKLAVFEKAAEALFYAVKNKVDLFILDIQLLDYRGTELARQLSVYANSFYHGTGRRGVICLPGNQMLRFPGKALHGG